MERTTRRSVALAIRRPGEPGCVLIVQRPDDDEDLPNVWGLPAASLRSGEDWEAAAERAGRGKLGVSLQLGALLDSGSRERTDYTLEMRLYEAFITAGTPRVPQTDAEVTQYRDWRWGQPEDLRPAAEQGSLCSTLFLRSG